MADKCIIPVIDLQDFPNQSSKLIEACDEWGCFRLLNYHQILPAALMSEMKTVTQSLLDLPVETKRRNVDGVINSGYLAPSPVTPFYEGFGLYDMTSSLAIDNFCSQLDASPHQRETITRYAEAILELFVRIGKEMAKGLGVKSENIGIENWRCQLRMNKYHFTSENVGSIAQSTHTDPAFLTILQDDEVVSGLDVMNQSGDFVPIDPWPGTLLVNLGDTSTVWSNGRFCNVKHRVQCKEPNTRLSIASFLLGPEILEPSPELVGDDHPSLFVPTTYEDYKKLRNSKMLRSGEVLELLHTPSSGKT